MAHMEPRLAGKRVILLAATGQHDHEFWVPYYRLQEEQAEIVVAGPEKGVVYRGEGLNGKDGLRMPETQAATGELHAGDFDAIIVPGGVFGPMRLRHHEPTLELIRAMDWKKNIIAAICHAPWVLISAEIVRGRTISCPPDMAVDIRNAGAEWVKDPAVRDGHLVTAQYFRFLPEFMRLVIDAIEG